MQQEIEVPVWVKRGNMLVKREALDSDDPDHIYNYIKNELGVRPEDYGVEKPKVDRCPNCGCVLTEGDSP
jgi:hypothetical protein